MATRNRTLVIGTCPKCQAIWDIETAQRNGFKFDKVLTLWQAVKIDNVRCSECNARITKASLEGRGKKPMVRTSQIRVDDGGKTWAFVYYKVTSDLKKELGGRNQKWPNGFKGNGTAFATVLKVSEDDLAQKFGMTVEQLTETRFDIGLKDK